ncbi:MAG: flavin reductase family protein [Terriglobales bacterium]
MGTQEATSTATDGGTATIDPRELRNAFGAFPSGVTALCAVVDGEPVGMAASSFTSLSLDPPQVLVCMARTSATWETLRNADRLGLSVLGHSQGKECRRLAGPSAERFEGTAWSQTDSGAIKIDGAPLFLETAVNQVHDGGDHHILVLDIHTIDADHEVAPLIFHRGSFHHLGAAH